MRFSQNLSAAAGRLLRRAGITKLKSDENGATAVEFAIVAVPFFMFIFGLIGISTYFFVMTSLDRGMDTQSRLIRTCQAQTNNTTVQKFKDDLCKSAGGWIKCAKAQVFVQKFPDWQSVQPQACVDGNGQVVANNANGSDLIAQYSGSANQVVLVTTCYKWDFAAKVPYIKLGNMGDGSMMMQTATAFRTEPCS